jgi:hypothetical protein
MLENPACVESPPLSGVAFNNSIDDVPEISLYLIYEN